MSMALFDRLPAAQAAEVAGVFTDIDDTLTTDGKLSAAAYDALWQLRDAGLRVVPVTGRPLGWCDLIARQWPVDAVIGENGAVALYQDASGVLRQLVHPQVVDPAHRARLREIQEAVLKGVPGSRVAKDQAYRVYDLAIDFAEEPPNLGLEAAQAIAAVFEEHGAQAKISSIHVNGWFGTYDKRAMAARLATHLWGETLFGDEEASKSLDETSKSAGEAKRYLFCGDSPNDGPMFSAFPLSCAMANIAPFVDTLRAADQLPRYVAPAPGGVGFAAVVQTLLSKRAALQG